MPWNLYHPQLGSKFQHSPKTSNSMQIANCNAFISRVFLSRSMFYWTFEMQLVSIMVKVISLWNSLSWISFISSSLYNMEFKYRQTGWPGGGGGCRAISTFLWTCITGRLLRDPTLHYGIQIKTDRLIWCTVHFRIFVSKSAACLISPQAKSCFFGQAFWYNYMMGFWKIRYDDSESESMRQKPYK